MGDHLVNQREAVVMCQAGFEGVFELVLQPAVQPFANAFALAVSSCLLTLLYEPPDVGLQFVGQLLLLQFS